VHHHGCPRSHRHRLQSSVVVLVFRAVCDEIYSSNSFTSRLFILFQNSSGVASSLASTSNQDSSAKGKYLLDYAPIQPRVRWLDAIKKELLTSTVAVYIHIDIYSSPSFLL
jgi:hypothetical protein